MKHADVKEALDLAEGEVGEAIASCVGGWFVHTHSSTEGEDGLRPESRGGLEDPGQDRRRVARQKG